MVGIIPLYLYSLSTIQPTEEFLETDSTIERREAHEERLLDLQANFNVLPEKFMEAVKEVHMPKRREHLPNKQWNTRYMRSTVELLPGESCAPQLAERMMQKQASRSIPSDRYYILLFYYYYVSFFSVSFTNIFLFIYFIILTFMDANYTYVYIYIL